MEYYETKAILLKYYDAGEADRLFVFFTHDFGKVRLIAKGARKSIKRHFTTIDLLAYLDVTFRGDLQKELQILSGIKMIEPFFNLRQDIRIFSTALYFVDLVDAFFKEQEKNERMFHDFIIMMNMFNKGGFKLSAIPVFQLKALECAGLSPSLITCLICNKPLDSLKSKSFYFSNEKGGSICSGCGAAQHHLRHRRKISLGMLKMLHLATITPVKDLGRINFTKKYLTEATTLLGDFIRYHINKNLKSYEYLYNIKMF